MRCSLKGFVWPVCKNGRLKTFRRPLGNMAIRASAFSSPSILSIAPGRLRKATPKRFQALMVLITKVRSTIFFFREMGGQLLVIFISGTVFAGAGEGFRSIPTRLFRAR